MNTKHTHINQLYESETFIETDSVSAYHEFLRFIELETLLPCSKECYRTILSQMNPAHIVTLPSFKIRLRERSFRIAIRLRAER
jgi:hypothetical protein